MPPNQIASASTLIVVSFRDASINSIKEYFFGMGVLKVEQISGRLTLQAVLHREELPLVDAATCSAFQVLFSSSAKANRAHACLNTHAINPIATERDLLILKPADGEGMYASFKVGTGVRHITMFSRNRQPSRVYDTLAQFGSVSLLYPHQDLGWIVYFENEEGACDAESKMSEIYQIDSIKKIPTDSTLYPEFFLDVISNHPSPSSITIIAPLRALSITYITSDFPDWIITQSANDFWNFLHLYPLKLRLSLLILGVIIKLCVGWVHFSAAKQNGPRTPR